MRTPDSWTDAMRMIVMLLLGLFVGALGAVTAISAMRQETPLSKAVMSVSGHHFRALNAMVKGGNCEGAAVEAHLRTIRSVAQDFDAAFLPTGGDDTQFQKHSADFLAALDGVMTSVPTTCPALEESVKRIGAGCKACHQDFR
jgi:cytochrome c556